MRLGYTMRALGVRCLAGLRQPSANRPVHEDAEYHRVIQQDGDDKGSGNRVNHTSTPKQKSVVQTSFQTTSSSLKFVDCRGKMQESSERPDGKLLHSADL